VTELFANTLVFIIHYVPYACNFVVTVSWIKLRHWGKPSACTSAAYYPRAKPVVMFGCILALCSIVLSCMTTCCWLLIVSVHL